MSTPKVVEILNGYKGTVLVCTEADEARYYWTATDEAILAGGTIVAGIETLDQNEYRRQGDHWRSFTLATGFRKVGEELAEHLNLVEQAAAAYKSSGQVQ